MPDKEYQLLEELARSDRELLDLLKADFSVLVDNPELIAKHLETLNKCETFLAREADRKRIGVDYDPHSTHSVSFTVAELVALKQLIIGIQMNDVQSRSDLQQAHKKIASSLSNKTYKKEASSGGK
jgi:hypothetical protein